MHRKHNVSAGIIVVLVLLVAVGQQAIGQIPNQLAQDFVAGKVPSAEDVAQYERESAANPSELHATRKLGKAYFFQFFGGGDRYAVTNAKKTLERALTLSKEDAETLAYLGALHVFVADRLYRDDPVRQKTEFDRGFELLRLAEKLDPRHG